MMQKKKIWVPMHQLQIDPLYLTKIIIKTDCRIKTKSEMEQNFFGYFFVVVVVFRKKLKESWCC